MAKLHFAATGARSAMDRLPRAEAANAMNSTSWLPLRALSGWTARDLNGDLAAGITLAAIAIPEQMATARLGGFQPKIGFFAFVAGSVAFALFGANRHLSVGADSTITPLFAGGLALIATSGSPHYLALAAMLALMVGLLVALSGILRLGWIADLLSVPVTTGFLAGISVHIVVSQLPGLLGLPPESGETLRRIGEVAGNIHLTNPWNLALGLGVFAIVFIAERISARIPAALIGMVLATLAVVVFGLKDRGVEVLGALPNGLPRPGMPIVGYRDAQALVPLALLIAIVVMVQTAATSRSFGPRDGEAPDVNHDFVGVGAGSIMAGLFGAFAVNSSPPRTAIVAQTGGRSQLSGLIAAAIVLVLGTFGGSLLANVPQAALAGVLLFVAQHIFRWQVFAKVYRQAPVEFALILITMIAIVVLPIETGVAIGIGLSLLHGIWGSTHTEPIELAQVPGTSVWWPPSGSSAGEQRPGVLVAAFQAPLSFVNADRFKRGLADLIDARSQDVKLVVLEASNIVEIDYTAAQALIDTIGHCRDKGAVFAIARMESLRAQAALKRFGIADFVGPKRIFHSVDAAIKALGPGQQQDEEQ
ncbi:SulP family inorganic anion transporter [Mesorhizobium sp. M1C.F.Ca.ET.193.01.1.1]|nr:SulP family inorganic anion transporter [Mesorhizobium sp. M1C.F.Ca.ET.210.01.1.1]TGQ75378.1 SulP family inorganic anion transporter [Mesorhizobium sp. M1C.F.Ca.ET.212.01.1.1]TGR13791.1 SulP family inorganic anion transporter [Mesorhizobium sp. M1C.F.Ca.ET.204.01.1.1]TGR34068.1 SulP family inorganic anion transporter [Mesorhizobium sp. M1C.F.Ca.ET.196.01.1.1]TGR56795.1 SulP family inorganic anion transporter [Mesorhizobium sp. M1C.F.Ca.ET.195.01.1.1]TGR69081.1 SulP family inorganic anion tr